MVLTSTQKPQTQTPAVTTGGTSLVGGAPNDQASSVARNERRKRLPKEWQAALGELPPDGPGALQFHVGLPEFRSRAYKLSKDNIAGSAETLAFLGDVNHDYEKALTEVGKGVVADRERFTALEEAIRTLVAGGDIGAASMTILATLGRVSEDGKVWLHGDPTMTFPLHKKIAELLTRPDEEAIAHTTSLQSLIAAIRNPHSATVAAPANVKPAPPTKEQTEKLNALIDQIKAQFPPGMGLKANATKDEVKKLGIDWQKLSDLIKTIKSADSYVRDMAWAWKEEGSGLTLLQLIGSYGSPSQVEQVVLVLDPIERLRDDLTNMYANQPKDPKAPRLTYFQVMYNFLVDHLGDETLRRRMFNDAPLMKTFFKEQSEADQRTLMRLMVSGRLEPDAVDKLHEAVDNGDVNAAINAIQELGQTPDRLKTLRADLVFTHRMQAKFDQAVLVNGIMVRPYDLFLRMSGFDSADTQEKGSVPKQGTVNTSSNPDDYKALSPEERGQLDAALYVPHAKKLAKELNSTFYVDDDVVMAALHEFERTAADDKIKTLLHRAKEAPGPTLAHRIQENGADVRLKLQRGLSAGNLVNAERILGFVTDQAAVGVIGGQGTLATDAVQGPKDASSQKKVPLEQALRETLVGTETLSAVIHKKATELETALNKWFGRAAGATLQVWRDYQAVVTDDVCKTLRTQTGLPRIWPIELLANAFVQVSDGTLQSKLSAQFAKDHPEVITTMGMEAKDVDTRRTVAEAGKGSDDQAAFAAARESVNEAAQAETFRGPAADVFGGLANMRRGAENAQIGALGKKLDVGLHLSRITTTPKATVGPPPAPVQENDVSKKLPGGPAHAGEPQPTDFVSFYRREYGIDPLRHAAEVANAMATKERAAKDVIALLLPNGPSIDLAPPPPPSEVVEVNEKNITLVGHDFTTETAKKNAKEMWDLIHANGVFAVNGQVQFLRDLMGDTFEEQRLIQCEFRNLSGGIDLSFYLQQHKAQIAASGGNAAVDAMSVGGKGADGKDERSIFIVGSAAETVQATEASQKGTVSLETSLATLIDANNMNEVYTTIEGASPGERRAVLANSALMTKLREFGDDAYEWNRIYKGLTGESDMFDRLESRAHGRHGIIGAFEGTDEKGMTKDIGAYAKQRREAITLEICGENRPSPAQKEQIEARLKVEFRDLADNPSVRAILNDELSGVELADRQGMLGNAGEEDKSASALTESDLTEDEEKIVDDIKKMSREERARRRKDPEYMRQLHKAIQTETTWRDAMMALDSDEDGSKGENEDNFSRLERASRSWRQDVTEIVVEQDTIIDALSKLTASEYQRLLANQRLQAQIFSALEAYPDKLAIARQMMSFTAGNAAQETGVQIGDKADPANKVFLREQVEGLAFMKFTAINRIRGANVRAWSTLLQAGGAIFNMKLRPSAVEKAAEKKEGGGEGGAQGGEPDPKAQAQSQAQGQAPQPNGKQPDATSSASNGAKTPPPKKEAPKDPEDQIEADLRLNIWKQVGDEIETTCAEWKTQEQADPKDRTKRISLEPPAMKEIIRQAVLHEKDPTDYLLTDSTGWFDNEEQIEEGLRKASDELLIEEWTTIAQAAPNGGESLVNKYQAWRDAQNQSVPMVPVPGAAGGEPDADGKPADVPMMRRPAVGSPEWKAKVAFQTHLIDTSQPFEKQLLRYAGGLFTDNAPTEAKSTEVRDNSEWLKWRSIVRDKIPGLDPIKIGTKLNATNDEEAMRILKDPTLRNTLNQLSYDHERYTLDRGKKSNYNIDRATAGGQGLALDNSMANYRKEVKTATIADGPNADLQFGQITAGEQGRIGAARERFNQSDSEFREAKATVANIAATIVTLIITAVITVLTLGSGAVAAPFLEVVLMGALTSGAASLGANATKEAIQGTDFAFSDEGLKAIARDTVMGAVTAGTTFYASKIASSLFNATTAAEQAAAISGIVKSQSFFLGLGRAMTEQTLQSGMQGVFETGMAAFDPALYLDGLSEGFKRGTEKGRERFSEIPGEMMRAAVIAAITHSAHAAFGKEARLKRQIAAADAAGDEALKQKLQNELTSIEEKKAAETVGHAATGDRKDVGDRAGIVLGKMAHGMGEGVLMGGSELLLDEKTYRGGGHSLDEVVAKFGSSIVEMMKLAATNLHMEESMRVERIDAGARQLHKYAHLLSTHEQRQYADMAMTGHDGSVLSVPEFQRIRSEIVNKEIIRHELETKQALTDAQKEAFKNHCREGDSFKDFNERAKAGPGKMPNASVLKIAEPVPVTFENQVSRSAELHRAEGVLKTIDAGLKTGQHQEAAAIKLGPQAEGLLREAAGALDKVPKGSPERARAAELLTQINDLAGELGRASDAPANEMVGLAALRTLLQQSIADAQKGMGAQGDPKSFQLLHRALIDAEAQAKTSPKNAEEAVAQAKQNLAELKKLVEEAKHLAVKSAKHEAPVDNSTKPAADTPDSTATKPVVAKVDPIKVEVDPTKVDPTKVDPTKVDPTKVDPTKVDSTKVDPTKVDSTKVDPTKVDPTKVDSKKTVDPQAGTKRAEQHMLDVAAREAIAEREAAQIGHPLTDVEKIALEELLKTHGSPKAEELFQKWRTLEASPMPSIEQQMGAGPNKPPQAQIELHNHITGNVEPSAFKAQLEALGPEALTAQGLKNPNQLSEWEPMLEAVLQEAAKGKHTYAEKDGVHQVDAAGKPIVKNRGVSGDAHEQARIAKDRIDTLKDRFRTLDKASQEGPIGQDLKRQINEIAKSAVDKAMRASDETDYNSGYEIIDELVKKHYGAAERNQMLAEAGCLGADGAVSNNLSNPTVEAAYREHFKGRKTVLDRIEAAVAAQRRIDEIKAGKGEPVKDGELAKLAKTANLISEQMSYDAYTMDALQRLAEDNVRYSEQSNSANKLDQRFDPEQLPWLKAKLEAKLIAEGKIELAQRVRDLEVKWVAMINTADFGDHDPNVKRDDVGKRKHRGTTPEDEQRFKDNVDQVVRQSTRKDSAGVDIAGMELYLFDKTGADRFKYLYDKLLETAKARGEKIALRPHVGEGASDVEVGKHGERNMDRQTAIDPFTGERQFTHVIRARENVEALLRVCEQIAATHDGKLPSEVPIRFGHATHATPDQAARMAALGIIVEINLHSNVETGATPQTDHPLDQGDKHRDKDYKPSIYERENDPQFEEHSLRTQIFAGGEIILSTDGPAVMNTDMGKEFTQAAEIIADVMMNKVPVEISGKQALAERTKGGKVADPGDKKIVRVFYEDMSPEAQQRYKAAYRKFFEAAHRYYDSRPQHTGGGDGRDGAPPPLTPPGDMGKARDTRGAKGPDDKGPDSSGGDKITTKDDGTKKPDVPVDDKAQKDQAAANELSKTKDDSSQSKDSATTVKTDGAQPTSAIRTPETPTERLDAQQIQTSVEQLKKTFGPDIAKADTKLVPPPSDRPVLEQSPSDALIGLPTNVISATATPEDAIKQLQAQGIPRWGALTAKERAHETAFAAELEKDLPAKVQQFLAASKDSDGRYSIEVDGAKKLYAEYGSKGAPESPEQLDVRATANHALHPAAVAVARLAFLEALGEIASLPEGDPRKMVFVTNGGCASGKGSLSDIVKGNAEKSGGKFDFGVKWDAAGEGDAQENGWILAAARAKGVKVTFGFVESDPTLTYKGVLDRALATGRIVDPVTFTRSYLRGQENMRAFLASPEYQQALKDGQVETVGVYTGQFDMKTKTFPNKRLLGKEGSGGRIGPDDIKPAAESEAVITEKAIKIFEEWLKTQPEAERQKWIEGGVINPLKFDPAAKAGAKATEPKEKPKGDEQAPTKGTASPIGKFHGEARQDPTDLSMVELREIVAANVRLVMPADFVWVDGLTFKTPGGALITIAIGDAPMKEVARYDGSVITVSPRAETNDVARALSHELGEIHAEVVNKLGGDDSERPKTMSKHLAGRMSELRMLLSQLDTALQRPNDQKIIGQQTNVETLHKSLEEVLREIGASDPQHAEHVLAMIGEADAALANRIKLHLENLARPAARDVTTSEKFSDESKQYLTNLKEHGKGEHIDTLVGMESIALASSMNREQGLRMFDPIFSDNAVKAEIRKLSDDMRDVFFAEVGKLRGPMNDVSFKTDASRAAKLESLIDGLANDPRFKFVWDKVDIKRMKDAAGALKRTADQPGVLVMDETTRMVKIGKSHAELGLQGESMSIDQLIATVDKANQAATENGLDIEYVVMMHRPNAENQSMIEIVSRPKPRYRVGMDQMSKGDGHDAPSKTPGGKGKYIVDVGVGQSAAGTEMSGHEPGKTTVIQTEYIDDGEIGQSRRDSGVLNPAPLSTPGAVLVYCDFLANAKFLMGEGGVAKVLLNNVSASLKTDAQYDTIAKQLMSVMAPGGEVQVQWDRRSETGEEKDGKVIEDDSRGHIDGKRLLDALLRQNAAVKVSSNDEKPIKYPYSIDAATGNTPKKNKYTDPNPQHRMTITF